MRPRAIAPILSLLLAGALAEAKPETEIGEAHAQYKRTIDATANMVSNQKVMQLARKHGMDVLNVTWEDTGRFKDSSVGPNISDMTIQVQQKNPDTKEYELRCMPVIRFPNFSDKTADLPIDSFHLLTGNEKGKPLGSVTLKDFLDNFRDYLHEPKSWKGKRTSLLAKRDKHVLVSAQACFLPVPKGGEAEFNPVLFNYQSYEGDPAVLSILVTREGTSATIIDNTRDGFDSGGSWGQRLFFNKNGDRAVFSAQRISDFVANPDPDAKVSQPEHHASEESGMNMVMLIQVPLKQKNPAEFDVLTEALFFATPAPGGAADFALEESNVEAAVIGHGRVEGPYTEIDGIDIERDTKYPIRVTVQFYKATSNGVVNEKDMADIAKQIKRVYDDGRYVGSLVTDGETGRPTEHDGPKQGGWLPFFGKWFD